MPDPKKPNFYVDDEAIHPIQVVARRTGLSADVIRAWERRYNAVVPKRSPTRRRLYTDEDVQRLRLLNQAIGAGRRIGDVVRLPLRELMELIGEDRDAMQQAPVPARDASVGERQEPAAEQAEQAHIDACLHAIERLDPMALETVLARAAIDCSLPLLLERVILGVMVAVGCRWQDGSMRLCHEHMATATIRSFLGGMAAAGEGVADDFGPALLVTTPEGQRHELGALMVALIAATKGWRPLYLGPGTPADEIAFAAVAKAVKAVALSISYPADDPRLPINLKKLRRQLPEKMPILVGGAAAMNYRSALDLIDAVCPGDMNDLQLTLDRLRES